MHRLAPDVEITAQSTPLISRDSSRNRDGTQQQEMEGLKPRLLAVLPEFIVTAFLIVYGLAITQLKQPWYFIIERDPALSMRANAGSTVSNVMLVVYGIIIPGALLIAISMWLLMTKPSLVSKSNVVYITMTLLLALGQSIGVALAGTNTIKIVTSRPRPGFFDLCNYAGYHDALASGNFAAYNAATTAGAIGDISKCLDASDLEDTLRSFPSGHASLSFAGLTLLMLAQRWVARVPKGSWFSPQALLCAWPLVLAAYVAQSRIKDGKHNPIDITLGTAIGVLGAYMAWGQFTSVPGRDILAAEADVLALEKKELSAQASATAVAMPVSGLQGMKTEGRSAGSADGPVPV